MRKAALILNYNTSARAISLAKSLKDFSHFDLIVVVDNNSDEENKKIIHSFKSEGIIVLETGENLLYSRGVNYGFEYLKDKDIDLVTLINTDTFIDKNSLEKCENALLSRDDLSVISPKMKEYGVLRTCSYNFPTVKHYIADNLGFVKLFKIKPKKREIDGNIEFYDYICSSLWILKFKDLEDVDFFDVNTPMYHGETCVALKLRKFDKRFALLAETEYQHNHIYKDGYKRFGYKESYKSLLYIFKTYLHYCSFSIFLYKISYYLGYALRKILRIKYF